MAKIDLNFKKIACVRPLWDSGWSLLISKKSPAAGHNIDNKNGRKTLKITLILTLKITIFLLKTRGAVLFEMEPMHLFDFSPKCTTHPQEDLEKYQSTFRNSAQNTPYPQKISFKIGKLAFLQCSTGIPVQSRARSKFRVLPGSRSR